MITLSLHAFSGHKHSVCHSKVEKHIHKKDFDCKLDILRLNASILTINNFKLGLNAAMHIPNNLQYNFLKNHYHLSFPLRGPPVCI